jgi:hypothetical protein
VYNVVYQLHTGVSNHGRAHFGQGTGEIWLDEVACRGTEARLVNCRSRRFGSHNCDHNDDVGVRCIPEFCKFSYYFMYHNIGIIMYTCVLQAFHRIIILA